MKTATDNCKMFPERIPNDWRKEARRRAEILLYDKLKESLSSKWKVFYDVAWLSKVRGTIPEDGQTDFILLHPDYGLLLVELKGGAISFSAQTGEWFSTDSGGTQHRIKDAFQQVERSKYALKNKLKTIPELASKQISIYDCVAFPDVRVGELSLRMDAPSEIIIDSDDLIHLEQKLFSILGYLSGGKKTPLTSADIDFITKLLAPTIELRNPLSAQFALEEQEIFKLTAQQFKILELLKRESRLAIAGCAGSGKTLIAVQKARQLAQEDFKTLICCVSEHLCKFIKLLLGNSSQIEVKTFDQLVYDFAENAELNVKGQKDSAYDDEHAALLLTEAASNLKNSKYDAIIVDEAQDFHRDWWDALDCCLVDGKKSILIAFYDDNQNLYRRDFEIPTNYVQVDLYDNVRNTQPIFRHVEHFYLSRSERRIEPRGPAGRSVQWYKYANTRDLEKNLDTLLRQLIRNEQIKAKDISIITPRDIKESELPSLKLQEPLSLVPLSNTSKPDEIVFASIHEFKGLEREIIVLTELDEIFASKTKEEIDALLYVAVSRAKHHLIVLSHKSFEEKLLPRK